MCDREISKSISVAFSSVSVNQRLHSTAIRPKKQDHCIYPLISSETRRRKITPTTHQYVSFPNQGPSLVPSFRLCESIICHLLISSRAHHSVRSQGMSPSLKRARKPFLTRNLLTGGIIAAFAAGTFWYSIAAVQQDDFVSSTFPNSGSSLLSNIPTIGRRARSFAAAV